MSFPFMQRLVAQRVETLGRRVGALLFSNTVGCVAGTLVTGFALLHFLGTPATLRVLAALLCMLGLAAAIGDRQPVRGAAAVGAYGLFAVLLPTGSAFWAPLHGAKANAVMPHEDGSCVLSVIEERPGQFNLYIAGERQNGVPFDDFHVRLGAVPALLHPNPQRVLVIGLGAGSTPFGLAMDGRVQSVECVEICPGELPLLKALENRRVQEMQRLFSESRIRYRFQDGRKYLLDTSERFDLIVTDTLLTISAFSGSLYSKEFYELVRARLNRGGMFAQWVPSDRILQTAASVFPHLAIVHSPELPEGEPIFFVASDRPITADREALLRRFDATDRRGLPEDSAARLRAFLSTVVATPPQGPTLPPEQLNRDLFPRDEYANW